MVWYEDSFFSGFVDCFLYENLYCVLVLYEDFFLLGLGDCLFLRKFVRCAIEICLFLRKFVWCVMKIFWR